ncbi:hypothetical protein SAICODRAFT_30924 [Saitoella complicata NRRL Y-17804]|nr:uncharacterized protein SAICODRAFT_30924 [Saitoella complicata NRRL Y-17804]ODQ52170.1 hypothetical protein SAICODRAFT_30924 [Saitoella complicata NRRL Y-17804]
MVEILYTTKGGSELQDVLLNEVSSCSVPKEVAILEEVAVPVVVATPEKVVRSKKLKLTVETEYCTFKEAILPWSGQMDYDREIRRASEPEAEQMLVDAARLKAMYFAEKAEAAAKVAAVFETTQKTWNMLAQAAISKHCPKPSARLLPQGLRDEITSQAVKVKMDARRDARHSTINGFRKSVLSELKELLPK